MSLAVVFSSSEIPVALAKILRGIFSRGELLMEEIKRFLPFFTFLWLQSACFFTVSWESPSVPEECTPPALQLCCIHKVRMVGDDVDLWVIFFRKRASWKLNDLVFAAHPSEVLGTPWAASNGGHTLIPGFQHNGEFSVLEKFFAELWQGYTEP